MAADEKTVYQLVNDYFRDPKNRKLLSKYMLNQYNYRTSRTIDSEKFIYFQMEDETELFEDTDEDTKKRDPKIGKIVCDYGLKFHVSIPEWDDELYKKSFDLLLPLLMGQQVEFKFLRSEFKMSEQTGQAGKDITIYANMTPQKSLEDWTDLIIRITTILVENDIPPGYAVEGTSTKPQFKIKGCNYVTYRYEDEAHGTHKRPKPDPVTSIRIEVQGQENPRPYINQNARDSSTIERDARRLNF